MNAQVEKGDHQQDAAEEETVRAEMDAAMVLLMDSELPVQAGGIVALTQLIRRRSPGSLLPPIVFPQTSPDALCDVTALVARLPDLFDILLAQLRNTDSYVFLAAVSALAALADCYATVRDGVCI